MEYKTPQGREYGMVYLGKGECKGGGRAPQRAVGSVRCSQPRHCLRGWAGVRCQQQKDALG